MSSIQQIFQKITNSSNISVNKYEFARTIGGLNIAIHPNSDDKHNYISYYVSNFQKLDEGLEVFK